jgi:hypothetical protein
MHGSIDRARQAAETLTYPSQNEVYERICERTAKARREWMEQKHAHDLARLAREMIAGSNSARMELETLVVEIDRFATDRGDTRAARFRQHEEHYEKTGERLYIYGESLYPEPPTNGEGSAAALAM